MGEGEQVPTFPQAEEFAKKCRVPLLTLFLTDPPANEIPLTDLRTVKDVARKKLTANFQEAINDAIVRQDWYREEFPDAKPRILAKQFTLDSDIFEVADYLRKALWVFGAAEDLQIASSLLCKAAKSLTRKPLGYLA